MHLICVVSKKLEIFRNILQVLSYLISAKITGSPNNLSMVVRCIYYQRKIYNSQNVYHKLLLFVQKTFFPSKVTVSSKISISTESYSQSHKYPEYWFILNVNTI